MDLDAMRSDADVVADLFEGAKYEDRNDGRRLVFATKILARKFRREPRIERTGKGLVDFFRAVRPTITPQADGFPKFSFDLAPA